MYGETLSYRDSGGEGPILVLVHGITSSVSTWKPAHPHLARKHRVISVDLLGHGGSTLRRGDYSLGAQAAAIRDLLEHLHVEKATFVGHSLGGGVVLQLSYLFPHLVDRLVLVSSGGLGEDVAPALRAATLPVAGALMPVLFWKWPVAVKRLGTQMYEYREQVVPGEFEEFVASLLVLADRERRAAFLATLRSVVDRRGQYVSALGKLQQSARGPVLLVWGEDDPVIPVSHGREAQRLLPGSRLELLAGGHFPHRSSPERFAQLVEEFTSQSAAARLAGDQ